MTGNYGNYPPKPPVPAILTRYDFQPDPAFATKVLLNSGYQPFILWSEEEGAGGDASTRAHEIVWAKSAKEAMRYRPGLAVPQAPPNTYYQREYALVMDKKDGGDIYKNGVALNARLY